MDPINNKSNLNPPHRRGRGKPIQERRRGTNVKPVLGKPNKPPTNDGPRQSRPQRPPPTSHPTPPGPPPNPRAGSRFNLPPGETVKRLVGTQARPQKAAPAQPHGKRAFPLPPGIAKKVVPVQSARSFARGRGRSKPPRFNT
jgi:hypothetical protein